MKALGLLLYLTVPLSAEISAVAHPGEEFSADSTVVWSPLIQAAWDRMNVDCGGKPLKVEPANALMEKLDHFEWQAQEVMPADGWKTWSGPVTRGFLEKANREAGALMKEAAPVFRLERVDASALALFSLLQREIVFEKALFRSSHVPLLFGAGRAPRHVRFFGVTGESSADFSDSIKVLACRPREKSYALELACKDGTESVILYRPAAKQDFVTACRWVGIWRKAWLPNKEAEFKYNDPSLHRLDEVKIPYLRLDGSADFAGRLTSLRQHPGGGPPRKVQEAQEKFRFHLHESGARVRMTVRPDIDCTSPPLDPETVPRTFAYDAPFFVFLWRKDAEWPYFGAWVGDASAMEAWE